MKDSCSNTLELSGLRLTPLRKALLKLFHSTRTPLSAPSIERHLRRLHLQPNKTTVYRTLDLFEGVGILFRTVVNERTWYYELKERDHHHHFICTGCDTMRDLPLSEVNILREAEKFAKCAGFTIEKHMLEFYGKCSQCHSRLSQVAQTVR